MQLKCAKCGTRFNSGFDIRGTAYMRGNYSSCPKCGHSQPLPNGHFEFNFQGQPTLLNTLQTPHFTREIAYDLKQISERFLHTSGTLEEFEAEVDKVDPRIFDKLRPYMQSSSFAMFLWTLISALAIIIGLSGHSSQGYKQDNSLTSGQLKSDKEIGHSDSLERRMREKKLQSLNEKKKK